MGQLRKRGNVWWIRYYRHGRRYEESSGSDKKKDAIALLRNREGDIAKGIPVSPRRLRFEEAMTAVVNDYKLNNRSSVESVERRLRKHLTPHFGGHLMAAITTPMVVQFAVTRQEAGASNAEINRELAIIKRAFSLAMKAGQLFHRPHIPMLQEDNARAGFFERDQFEAVRSALPDHLRGLVTFAYITGWRIQSEVLPLEWRQVDREAGTVRLEPGTTKNRKARVFYYKENPNSAM